MLFEVFIFHKRSILLISLFNICLFYLFNWKVPLFHAFFFWRNRSFSPQCLFFIFHFVLFEKLYSSSFWFFFIFFFLLSSTDFFSCSSPFNFLSSSLSQSCYLQFDFFFSSRPLWSPPIIVAIAIHLPPIVASSNQ